MAPKYSDISEQIARILGKILEEKQPKNTALVKPKTNIDEF